MLGLLKDSQEGAKGPFVMGLEWKPCREAAVTSLSGKVEEGRGQERDLGAEWVWYGRKTEGCFPKGTVEEVGEFV